MLFRKVEALIESHLKSDSKIQTYDNKTFWSLEFIAEFTNETGEKTSFFRCANR
jgi:hypothetical protein